MGKTAGHRLPDIQNLFTRQRIKELIARGMQGALVTITAPPGYGKTHDVVSFFGDASRRLCWMRITPLDTLPSHFWANFISSLETDFPNIAKGLWEVGFPDSLAKIDICLRIIAEDIYSGPPAAFVFDDFAPIVGSEAETFLKYLADSQLENFALIIVSRKKTNIDSHALKNSLGLLQIGEEDLKFTEEEARALFAKHSVTLLDDQFEEIYRRSGGWPLMLYLASQHLKAAPFAYEESYDRSLEVVTAIYESDFFLGYSASVRTMLIKLAIPSGFTLEMIESIGGVDIGEFAAILENNIFISYIQTTKEYILQHQYREFLSEKLALVPQGQRRNVYRIAGDYALKYGHELPAIEYYEKGEYYDDMLETIAGFIGSRMIMSTAQTDFFLEKLDHLPEEVQKSNYLADYIRVCILIQSLKTDEALTLLLAMEKKYLGEGGSRAILGEIYERMAGIYMMQNNEHCMDYYKKAYEHLLGGSKYKSKKMLRFRNYCCFSIQDYTPGAIGRMEKALHDNIEYMVRVENGGAAGFAHLYSAEAGYYTHAFDEAKKSAHSAIYDAKPVKVHDIVCNAYFILAKTAYMQGHYNEMTANIEHIKQYVVEIDVPGMNHMSDYAQNWLELKMGHTDNLPKWISAQNPNMSEMMPLVIGREELLYADYLLLNKQYGELAPYLERVRHMYMSKGWGDSVSASVLLALSYFKLSDTKKAIGIFRETYDMTYANGIITPFIEPGGVMRTFVEHVRKSGLYEFDGAWLDNISRKASTFAKRLSYMQKEYYKENHLRFENEKQLALSEKELALLQNLAQGLTREEIAEEAGISLSTVKTTITNIYNKLGAINRADAVRIAIANGLLA